MSVTEMRPKTGPVHFTGTRGELFGLLFRGYLLLLPTLGIYRFWVTTWKRRYYWQHTVIDGQPLEYTGSATQLLIGFLIAVAIFLPLYGGFFYLSTQTSDVVLWGYAVIGVLFWFAQGYAIYRARDFRLSRTLWRGIRFDQKGSALGYAFRRFLWSLLVLVTLGLAYPFMASSLWRYRYRHSFYGDRPFTWTGTWKTIAGPYYLAWLVVAVLLVVAVMLVPGDLHSGEGVVYPGATALLVLFGVSAGNVLAWLYFRSREATRMFSAVRLGEAGLQVKVKLGTLLGQGLLYGLCAGLALIIFGGFILGFVYAISGGTGGGADDLARIARTSVLNVSILLVSYLLLLGALGLFAELFLGRGFWATVASGAVVTNPESLHTVRATAEDPSLAGEGLADALNVGAY
ncbi:MAG TPA: DUF898 family protein [Devosia sp.]